MDAKNSATAHGTLDPASAEELDEFDARWASHRAQYGDRTYNEFYELHSTRGFWDVSDPNFDGIDARGFDYEYVHAWTGETVDHSGRDWRGVDEAGFDLDGWSADGQDREGYDREGYNVHGYGRDGFDRDDYDRQGYHRNGLHRETGRTVDGWDRHGVNRRGFRWDGIHTATGTRFDEAGYDIKRFDADGFDRRGRDSAGYDRDGFDYRGFDKDGLMRDGSDRDSEGRDADGFDADGFRSTFRGMPGEVFDRQGYNQDGYDIDDRNRRGHFQGNKRESLWWASDSDEPWYMPEKSTQPFFSGFPYTRKNLRPWDIYTDCTVGVYGGGGVVRHGRNDLTLHWRARELYVLGQYLSDARKTGQPVPLGVREWAERLEALKGHLIAQMPETLSYERRYEQMMALALRAGLGYSEPSRRELIDLGYEEEVRHYAPTLKWRKRSTLGSAA